MEVVEHSDSSKIARTGDRLSVDLAMIVLAASPLSSEAATTSGMSALARLALSPPTREASSPGRTITTAISVGGKAHMQRESTRAKAPPCPVVVRKQTPCRIFLCSEARSPTTQIRNHSSAHSCSQLSERGGSGVSTPRSPNVLTPPTMHTVRPDPPLTCAN